jgi:hypothetical protein
MIVAPRRQTAKAEWIRGVRIDWYSISDKNDQSAYIENRIRHNKRKPNRFFSFTGLFAKILRVYLLKDYRYGCNIEGPPLVYMSFESNWNSNSNTMINPTYGWRPNKAT